MVRLAELHQQIRSAIEAGENERARQACRSILAARPDNLETLLLLAEVDLESGRHREAMNGFERVLAGDPEAFLAYAGLGIAYESVRDPAATLHWYSRALDLDSTNRELRLQRDQVFEVAYPGRPLPAGLGDLATARSFFQAGFYEQAIDTYRRALEHEPGRLEIKLGLAEAYWLLDRLGYVEVLCQEVLADAPRVVKANALLACVAVEEGDLARGEELLVDVHRQDPDGRIAAHLIAETQLAPLATEPVELGLELSPPSTEIASIDELPPWVNWMREALWRALRLVWPPEDQTSELGELPAFAVEARQRASSGPIGRRLKPAEGDADSPADDEVTPEEQAMVSEEITRIPLRRREPRVRPAERPAPNGSPRSPGDESTEFLDRPGSPSRVPRQKDAMGG